jgi:hypothetical protein
VFGACLHPGAQSAGLGRAMIDHLLTSAAASGVRLVDLTVHPDNWRALRLYQRAGFRLVDDFINQHQGVMHYRMRMRVDVRLPRPTIAEDLTIFPRGGLGVAKAAALVQASIEGMAKHRPLILDRPACADARVIYVVDLSGPAQASIPGSSIGPPASGLGWIESLDDHHLLIGGVGPVSVHRACRHYATLLADLAAGGEARDPSRHLLAITKVPIAGLHLS